MNNTTFPNRIYDLRPSNRFFLCLSFVLLLSLLKAQDLVNFNKAYLPSVKSIQFGVPGLQAAFPIVNLEGGALTLEFDEVDANARYLQYFIQHCNRDWSPSDLQEMEFIQGFNGEEIRDYAFSVNTRVDYVHYQLNLPNQDMRWTKSGNYLLHIVDEDTGEPLLTRRFLVVDPIMRISGFLDRPADVSKIQTHHEIDFRVNHKDVRIANPQIEIRASILQNGRWDNAITEIEPFRILREQLSFEYLDKIVFPAGKQFRTCDFRSLRYPSIHVNEIKAYEDAWEVRMKRDEKRTFKDYQSERDLNGQFIVDSQDDNNPDIQADYAYVVFSLNSVQPLYDYHVYLIGGFTDWLLEDQYILNYEERYGCYMGEALLKQGFYDYLYAAVPKNGEEIDLELLEGNWHETENYYTILIYYRPFGTRYDQLVAVQTLSDR